MGHQLLSSEIRSDRWENMEKALPPNRRVSAAEASATVAERVAVGEGAGYELVASASNGE